MENVVKVSDRVNVVRCKDCRHYRKEPSQVRHNVDVVWCDKHNNRGDCINLAAVDDNWYCADGERKGELTC